MSKSKTSSLDLFLCLKDKKWLSVLEAVAAVSGLEAVYDRLTRLLPHSHIMSIEVVADSSAGCSGAGSKVVLVTVFHEIIAQDHPYRVLGFIHHDDLSKLLV